MSTFVHVLYHLRSFVSLVPTVCVDAKLNTAKGSRLGRCLAMSGDTCSFKYNLELSIYLVSFEFQISLDHICSTYSRFKINSLDGIERIKIGIA